MESNPVIPFAEGIELDATSAKQDRIEVVLGDWILSGRSPQIGQIFLNRLSNLRLPTSINPHDIRWFRSDQRNRGRYITFRSRERSNSDEVKPLIAGEVRLRPLHNSEHGNDGVFFTIKVTLYLNPTRFAQHHAVRIRGHLFNEIENLQDDVLLATSPSGRNLLQAEEIVLDRKDNVLLSRRTQAVSSPQFWPYLLRYYWQNVVDFLETSFAGELDDMTALGRPRSWCMNLKNVETYFEFYHDDAVYALQQIKNSLRAFGRRNYENAFLPLDQGGEVHPMFREGRRDNSPSFSIQLTNSVKAVVYAKTNKRIRLEIRHRLNGENSSAALLGGAHTHEDHQQLYPWLETLAIDATTRGNSILGYIGRHNWERVSQRPLYTFLARIVDACEDQAQYDLLLSSLINNDTIHVPRGDELLPIISSLLNQGILQRTNPHAQTFSIHPQYQETLQQLQNGQA